MCGIVGYIGNKNAQDFLLSGLKRLEYRGYDSAGVVTIDDKPTLLKVQGKVTELEKEIAAHKTTDHIGIGHTRWATHGEPSIPNAHPHHAGSIYLVHNGIIENYQQLKSQLEKHDYKFRSETDSEVLAALIDYFYQHDRKDQSEPDLTAAVIQALKLVQGTYGIAALALDQPDQVVVARSGSPLIIGVGNHETLIASDASALVGHTQRAIYLNDGEVATITADSIDLKTLAAEPVSAKVETIETNLDAIQKGDYDHFLLKEIMEQPDSLKETLRGRVNRIDHTIHLGGPNLTTRELQQINHLVIVGCGTAHYAAQLAAYYIEQFTPELTIETVIASEYRYRQAYIPKDSVAVVVSQSGETADTLACLRAIKQQGIKTIGIVNSVGSTIAREVDGGTYIHVGPEISVASTKAFTSQAIAIIMFGLTVAQAKGVRPATLAQFVNEISNLPAEIATILTTLPEQVQQLAAKYQKYDHAIYLGRDTAYPIALEGALKLKEVSYADANAYAAGELKHGPIALIDDRFFEVIFLPDNELYEKSCSAVEEVLARGGHVIVVTNRKDFDLPVEAVVQLDTRAQNFAPLLFNLFSQLFAYYFAVGRGLDVDQPRNLAKSVTVE